MVRCSGVATEPRTVTLQTWYHFNMTVRTIESKGEKTFIEEATRWLSEHTQKTITQDGYCILGLSGGSTPKPIYTELGKQNLDWSKISIFLIDERYCPPSDNNSNQKMVRETLLANAAIPESNIVFPDTSLPIEKCIEQYSIDLKKQWTGHLPHLEILGMGEDGHIASLFPPLAPELMDESGLVHHTTTDQFAVHDRLTLSLNAVTCANEHLFLLKGAEKKRVWDEMMASNEDERRWPAKRVLKTGEVTVVWTTK